MKVGEKISTLRRKQGLSQEELAVRLNVTRQAVSKWETGTSVPELETLVALAKIFGVTTDYLLSVEKQEEPSPQPEEKHPDMLDRLSGFFEKLHRRYGWLGGVYLAISGAGFLGIGFLSRLVLNGMFGNPGIFGTAAADPFFAEIIRNNPIYTMGTFLMILGVVMIASGVILALWLRKRK